MCSGIEASRVFSLPVIIPFGSQLCFAVADEADILSVVLWMFIVHDEFAARHRVRRSVRECLAAGTGFQQVSAGGFDGGFPDLRGNLLKFLNSWFVGRKPI
jgi:hypothetical protein